MKNITTCSQQIRVFLNAIAGIVIIMLSGCATTGPAFTATKPQSGKTLIYLLRKSSFYGCGGRFAIYENGKPITVLVNGGYFPYQANPGLKRFHASSKITPSLLHLIDNEMLKKHILAEINASVGQTYYLEFYLSPELKARVLSPSEALPVLSDLGLCRDDTNR